MYQFIIALFILSCSVIYGENVSDLDKRLERMRNLRLGGSCSIPWKGGVYRGEIQAIQGNHVKVRVLDHSLPLGKWPLVIFPQAEVKPSTFEKALSNEELIQSLKDAHILETPAIEQALRVVDRAWFCLNTPYFDAAIDIGCEVCISSPHMHVWALELSRDLFKEATSILDVGTGSGYLAAALAYLSAQANVYGLEYHEVLTQRAEQTLQIHVPQLAEQITLITTDGEQGYLPGAPYDIIHVGFMCQGIPQALIDQLKPGGRLILPAAFEKRRSSYDHRLASGEFTVVEKRKDGKVQRYRIMPCSYLPSESLGE